MGETRGSQLLCCRPAVSGYDEKFYADKYIWQFRQIHFTILTNIFPICVIAIQVKARDLKYQLAVSGKTQRDDM